MLETAAVGAGIRFVATVRKNPLVTPRRANLTSRWTLLWAVLAILAGATLLALAYPPYSKADWTLHSKSSQLVTADINRIVKRSGKSGTYYESYGHYLVGSTEANGIRIAITKRAPRTQAVMIKVSPRHPTWAVPYGYNEGAQLLRLILFAVLVLVGVTVLYQRRRALTQQKRDWQY